jgi:hypothetical protein
MKAPGSVFLFTPATRAKRKNVRAGEPDAPWDDRRVAESVWVRDEDRHFKLAR